MRARYRQFFISGRARFIAFATCRMMAAGWFNVPSASRGITKSECKVIASETTGCAETANTANDRKLLNEDPLMPPDKT